VSGVGASPEHPASPNDRPSGAQSTEAPSLRSGAYATVPARGEEETSELAAASAGEGSPVDLAAILRDGIERIVGVIEGRHRLDRFREAQVDKLHAELQEYKSDLVAKAIAPLVQAMIRLHDNAGRALDAFAQQGEPGADTAAKALELLAGFREDVEAALADGGVTAFRGEAPTFDTRRQKAIRTVTTRDPSLVGTVVARVRPGFEHGDRVLEKERVAVYVLGPETAGEKSTS
jgi:molecular chaperone GrpE (heat shock protein)